MSFQESILEEPEGWPTGSLVTATKNGKKALIRSCFRNNIDASLLKVCVGGASIYHF